MYCEVCERMNFGACRECELRKENGVLREQLAEKERMIETLMREPRIDREARLRAALAKANDQKFWIGVANMWRNMAVKFAAELSELKKSVREQNGDDDQQLGVVMNIALLERLKAQRELKDQKP